MNEFELEINNEIKRKKKMFMGMTALCGILMISFIMVLILNFGKALSFISFTPVLLAISIFIMEVYLRNHFLKNIKTRVMFEVLPKVLDGKELIYVPNGIPKKEFNASKMYIDYTNYYSSDGVKDFFNDFFISNVVARKKIGDRKLIRFSGIYGYMKLNEPVKEEIIIKPGHENKYVNTVIESKNKMLETSANKLSLENPKFDYFFDAYSKDQVKAREIVTIPYMEMLVQIRERLKVPIKIVYKEDRKYIAIWNDRILSEDSIYKEGVNIEKLAIKLKSIYKIFEIL